MEGNADGEAALAFLQARGAAVDLFDVGKDPDASLALFRRLGRLGVPTHRDRRPRLRGLRSAPAGDRGPSSATDRRAGQRAALTPTRTCGINSRPISVVPYRRAGPNLPGAGRPRSRESQRRLPHMNGTDFTYRRVAALLVPVLLLLAVLAVAVAPRRSPSRRRRSPGAPVTARAAAPAEARRRRGEPDRPRPRPGAFVGMNGRALLLLGLVVCVLGLIFGLVIYQPAQEPARARVDAGHLGADLRDLQDVPDHPGQVHPDPRGLHRRHHRPVLRLPPALRRLARDHHPALQPDRHRGQLRRGVVRHPHQHLRQLAHRLREPRGQALPGLRDPAQGGHVHRHAADQRRAVHHAVHPALHPRRLRRAPASSASPSASRSAPPRSASRAASSPRSPTSAPTS